MRFQLNLDPSRVRAALRALDLRPTRGMGQNFLTDPAALNAIVSAAESQRHEPTRACHSGVRQTGQVMGRPQGMAGQAHRQAGAPRAYRRGHKACRSCKRW